MRQQTGRENVPPYVDQFNMPTHEKLISEIILDKNTFFSKENLKCLKFIL